MDKPFLTYDTTTSADLISEKICHKFDGISCRRLFILGFSSIAGNFGIDSHATKWLVMESKQRDDIVLSVVN